MPEARCSFSGPDLSRIRAGKNAPHARARGLPEYGEGNRKSGICWLQSDENRSLPSNVPGGVRPDRFYSWDKFTSQAETAEA